MHKHADETAARSRLRSVCPASNLGLWLWQGGGKRGPEEVLPCLLGGDLRRRQDTQPCRRQGQSVIQVTAHAMVDDQTIRPPPRLYALSRTRIWVNISSDELPWPLQVRALLPVRLLCASDCWLTVAYMYAHAVQCRSRGGRVLPCLVTMGFHGDRAITTGVFTSTYCARIWPLMSRPVSIAAPLEQPIVSLA
jgi:hypothetical protein